MTDNNKSAPSPDELFLRHRHSLVQWLRRRFGLSDAEDVAQETFVRLLHQSPSEQRGLKTPGAWLHKVAGRLAVDRLRREQVRSRIADQLSGEAASPAGDPLRNLDYQQRMDRLQTAVMQLPERCRQVFVLHKLRHLSYREVAQHLGISESMVEKHMARAMRHLLSLLEEIEP